jgi:dTDP-4-amino-4,6-dideoxy-D-galactose acyltransferase
MYDIQLLDWDTNFFGYRVGKLNLSKTGLINLNLSRIETNSFDLIYLFVEQSIDEDLLSLWRSKLQYIKIELVKDVNTSDSNLSETGNVIIKPISVFTDELFHLVLESGVFSRFKQDKNFVNNEFERLYRAWIDKAINDRNAKVVGAFINDELIGFVSLSLKSGVADIGLIAVHQKARGKYVGKKLLESAYQYATLHHSKTITVVTQENNIQALQFYLRNGFKIENKNYIFHLWKKIQ